ncbi:hypothetical protein LTR62_002207 [Meristemomyces frigidus]|uniref:RING-type domain-containing protein n=1 Tax=Meristemomyces frigidus TaxID=1508187 RepID=A0AAN7YS84_9PEZI|nr:hypothetical protein LTR62_002207 [Meristemomyces frigidus]
MSQPPALTKATSNVSSKGNSATTAQVFPAASRAEQFFSNTSGGRYSTPARPQAATPKGNQNNKQKHKSGKKSGGGLLDDDELLAMQNIGRRGKQADITHLMNIALPPRPQQSQNHRHSYNAPRRAYGGGRGAGWGMGSGYHAVDKARYIHANYRFIVTPQGDYAAQATDADVPLDWSAVLQVIASPISQQASCPICLGDPVAPRMAKCGHIFCLPCLIRYMHSDNDPHHHEKRARWKKCPICEDSIYTSETRPVRWYAGQEAEHLREGSDIVLRLVKRKAGQTLGMPRDGFEVVTKGDSIPWYFAAEVMDYARVMKGSEEYITEQFNEAIVAIQKQEKEDELMFGEDAEWTSRAVRTLYEAKEKVKGIGSPPEQPKKPEQAAEKQARRPIQFNDNNEGVPDMYLQRHANDASMLHHITEAEETTAPKTDAIHDIPRTIHEMRQRQFAPKPEPNEYLFYQAPLHYYLSPLDIRILKSAFGSYSTFPSSILPRVERISSGHVVDDELRRRIKYLAHLPYGCEVEFLECDWTDTVSPAVLAEYQPMLDRRRKKHDEKEAREEKERVRIEKMAEKDLAHIRRTRHVPPSISDDPTLSTEWEALPAPVSRSYDVHGSGNEATSPPSTRAGFGSLASPSSSPSMHRTVWGTTAVHLNGEPDFTSLPSDNEFSQRDDGWLQGWEKDLLDSGEAPLTEADIAALSLSGDAPVAEKKVAGGKKGGKKGKKITLMSTSARRAA